MSPSAWMPAVWVNTFSPEIGLLAGTRRPENTSNTLLMSARARSSTPVLQIHVERDAALRPVLEGPANVVQMLLVRLFQLLAAMVQRAFGQQVDDAHADGLGPVDRLVQIDEPQDFHAVRHPFRLGVLH